MAQRLFMTEFTNSSRRTNEESEKSNKSPIFATGIQPHSPPTPVHVETQKPTKAVPSARENRTAVPLYPKVLGTSGDHLGDHLGTIIRRSYRFSIIFNQNMSFLAKHALSKFRMSFFTSIFRRSPPRTNKKT